LWHFGFVPQPIDIYDNMTQIFCGSLAVFS
jgi:hypothetical protein